MPIQVSGFTFVRDAVKLDYPVVESIRSILPIVDEYVVNVGPSEDDTEELIRSIGDPKIRIIHSTWNPHACRGAFVYAQQTNVALFNCRGRWAFYLQSDEVIHEADLPKLEQAMAEYADDGRVDGLAVEQLDFWGDYHTVVNIWPWRGATRCRVVKPHHFVLSRGDALGFTVHPKYKERGRMPRAVETGARQFHYCRIKSLAHLAAKRQAESRYWSERSFPTPELTEDYFYQMLPRSFVAAYEGSHPAVMAERIANYRFRLDLDSPRWRTELTSQEWRTMTRHRLFQWTAGQFSRRGFYKKVA
jgi:glycosyltransferase involved in cell wall biosynthesis